MREKSYPKKCYPEVLCNLTGIMSVAITWKDYMLTCNCLQPIHLNHKITMKWNKLPKDLKIILINF